MDIDDEGYVTLMDDSQTTRSDLKLPEGDLAQEIKGKFESDESVKITVLKAMEEEAIIGYKIDTKA